MPTDHRFGVDDHKCLFPLRPQPSDHHPEKAIKVAESGLWTFAFESHKLPAESKILRQKVSPRVKKTSKQAK